MSALRLTPFRAPRRTFRIGAGLVALLAFSVFSGSASAQDASDERPTSIVDYMQRPGDQVVTIPDGTYSGGRVTAPHPETDGRFGGWLILVAEHPGKAVVDLSTTPDRLLHIQRGTNRVAFIGISFTNGVVRNEGDHLRYWYTDHQNPDYDYLQAGRFVPRMFQAFGGSDNLEMYGSDLHNGIATAVFFGADIDNITLQGMRNYNIDRRFEDPVDPNSHISGGPSSPEGAHSQVRILDSYFERYYMLWGSNAGSSADLLWQDIWYGFGNAGPFLLQATPGHEILRARRVNWQIFGPNAEAAKNGTDPYIYIDDAEYGGSAAFEHKDRIDLVDTNVTYGFPTGVTDEVSALDSPQNPANKWRAAHPYDSWRSFFGWPEDTSSSARPIILIAIAAIAAMLVAASIGVVARRSARRGDGGYPDSGPEPDGPTTSDRASSATSPRRMSHR